MIRIEPSKISDLHAKYLVEIFPSVRRRVNAMKYCLDILGGNSIDVEADEFVLSKKMIESIIRRESPKYKLEDGSFNKANYEKTVLDYLAGNTIPNLSSMADLVNGLLEDDAEKLKYLLIAPANSLASINDRLENMITTEQQEYFAKLFLNYEDHSSDIVQFFREHNHLKFCPYCNLDSVEYLTTSRGKAVETPTLDHFFSKADHPFLSCSLFNLVPSCNTCNVTK